MANLSVEKLATVIGSAPELLLSQMKEAGLKHSELSDEVTDSDKKTLLDYLKKQQSKTSKTISLKTTKSKEIKKESGSIDIKRKKANIEISSSLEEKTKKTSSNIDFAEIEKKRQAGETLKQANEDQRKQKNEQKTLITRRKAKSGESVSPSKEIKHVVKSKKPSKALKPDLTKKEKRELEGEDFLSNVQKQEFEMPSEFISRTIQIPESITVSELAQNLSIKGGELVKKLMSIGVMATLNQALDQDTAILVTEELGHKGEPAKEIEVEDRLMELVSYEGNEEKRNPVVSVLGHVDHGKTTLLDYVRKANVAEGEEGGITQKIGAYQANTELGTIAFIDTPGHAAFSEVRARGANSTDIVILVVAADDSVMPQTIEAINHSKEANVPIIVAVNKIDKSEANPTKTKNDLLEHELIVEELGGDIQCIELSAQTKEGIEELLEAINLQAEILDLKANPDRQAEGFVIESKLDKGRGPVVTTIIQKGTLKKGDIVIVGQYWGKVRSLINDKGDQVNECFPGDPIEVLGLNNTPNAGDFLSVVENEARAREITEYRDRQNKKETPNVPQSNIEQMLSKIKDETKKELPVIIKADVHGSSEAIKDGVLSIGNDEISCRVVHTGVGAISESDISLAETSNSIVFGFNVRANTQAKDLADKSQINIIYHSIIYDLLDDIKNMLEGRLDPELKENILGNAEVLEVFKISKTGNIAGCLINDGTIKKGEHARLIRDGIVVYEGKISELKRFKDDVKEVQSGQECGLAFDNNEDIKPKDKIECYEVKEIKKKI